MDLTIQQLLIHNVHLTATSNLSTGALTPYLLGTKKTYGLIDLNKTQAQLKIFLFFLVKVALKRQTFLTTNHKFMANLAKNTLDGTSEAYEGKWLGGLLTNHKVIRTSKRFKKRFALLGFRRLPTLLMVLNATSADWPTREALLIKMPCLSVVDGDSAKPWIASYTLPGNNHNWSALHFYLKLIRAAIIRGGYLEKTNLVTLA